ncbi:hypothetical protein DV736_g397, partial [Chaetothyriales sp. CBS 134916]
MAFGRFFGGSSSSGSDKSGSTSTFESQAPSPSDATLATAPPSLADSSATLSPSPPNATSAQIRQRLQNAVLYQTNMMNAKFLISKVNENCFDKCVQSPGSNLSSKEQACLSSCLEKYIEAWNTRRYEELAKLSQALFSMSACLADRVVHPDGASNIARAEAWITRKPTCKNCDKPGRVCHYELSKRDHHNPTVETTDLPKYFNADDRPDYSAEQLASFRPVPDPLSAAAANYTTQAMATYSGTASANVIDPSLDSRRLSLSPVEGVQRQDSGGVRVRAESDAADAQLAQALLEAQQEETVVIRRTINQP